MAAAASEAAARQTIGDVYESGAGGSCVYQVRTKRDAEAEAGQTDGRGRTV